MRHSHYRDALLRNTHLSLTFNQRYHTHTHTLHFEEMQTLTHKALPLYYAMDARVLWWGQGVGGAAVG